MTFRTFRSPVAFVFLSTFLSLAAVVVFALLVGAPAPVHAQNSTGTIQTVDLGSLGWGVISQPKSVEVDGNPLTQEWVVSQVFTANHRLIFADATGLNIRCTSDWLDLSGGWVWQQTAGPSGVLLHRLTRQSGTQFSVWTLPVVC